MCGRLVLTSSIKKRIADIFDGVNTDITLGDRYNVTPMQPLAIIANDQPTHLRLSIWGLPASSPSSRPHINARGETVDTLASFRDAFGSRRCIIVADGFYEWKREGSSSSPQPYYFSRRDQAVLLMAGLWHSRTPDSQQNADTNCLIITTEANSLMHPVHHRMPVLFSPESAHVWLHSDTSRDTLKSMLQPFPSDQLQMHPVSQRVNRRGEDHPDLIKPVQILEQTNLF